MIRVLARLPTGLEGMVSDKAVVQANVHTIQHAPAWTNPKNHALSCKDPRLVSISMGGNIIPPDDFEAEAREQQRQQEKQRQQVQEQPPVQRQAVERSPSKNTGAYSGGVNTMQFGCTCQCGKTIEMSDKDLGPKGVDPRAYGDAFTGGSSSEKQAAAYTSQKLDDAGNQLYGTGTTETQGESAPYGSSNQAPAAAPYGQKQATEQKPYEEA